MNLSENTKVKTHIFSMVSQQQHLSINININININISQLSAL